MASRSTTQTPKISSTEGASRPAATAAKAAAKTSTEKAEKSTATASRAPRKSVTAPGAGTGNAIQVTPEERQRYVSEAAFFIAERRGFSGGCELEDWLQAEAQIDQLLAGSTRH
ncbi:MAG: hypothetical protein H6R11_288 [Proteobacteria bacterium]|jgi:hypothetical protein|nr:hypothetical protein [Pseudomonadota bacterium]MBS1171224.1 hypothetical protein [Pseudomonadota bacterium]